MLDELYTTPNGDTIRIEADPDDGTVRAYLVSGPDDESEIGLFTYEITVVPDGYDETLAYNLESMNVSMKKQGIGTEMIKLAEECFNSITYPKNHGSSKGIHLTDEGFTFMQACINKGIIDHDL